MAVSLKMPSVATVQSVPPAVGQVLLRVLIGNKRITLTNVAVTIFNGSETPRRAGL